MQIHLISPGSGADHRPGQSDAHLGDFTVRPRLTHPIMKRCTEEHPVTKKLRQVEKFLSDLGPMLIDKD